MAECRIVHEKVNTVIGNIANIKSRYDSATESFINSFHAAISEMEGESKDALLNFFDKDAVQFIQTDLPGAIEGMRSLLEANLVNFRDVDKQIADCISGS